jgi:AraC family transcriptional regulator
MSGWGTPARSVKNGEAGSASVRAMSQRLEDLLPLLAAIAASRGERRSLADLAREAGASTSTFQRAFSRIVGESPKQYTRRLQLERAALALLGSDASVLDVALDAGFESHEGFTRVFSRHFGTAPSEFRKRHAHLAREERHLSLMSHIGPCLGLFRASLTDPHPKEKAVNYDITRQAVDETVFLYKKGRCAHAEIAQTLGQLLPAVFEFAVKNGIEFRSPPTSIYQEWGPGMVTLHAGMSVASASPGDEIFVETLPACEAAVTIHTGPYDDLGDAHAAVEQYIAEQNLERAGPPREIYLTDPGEVPDPGDWKTQIVWPVKRAGA